jgi:hypothetical protein
MCILLIKDRFFYALMYYCDPYMSLATLFWTTKKEEANQDEAKWVPRHSVPAHARMWFLSTYILIDQAVRIHKYICAYVHITTKKPAIL